MVATERPVWGEMRRTRLLPLSARYKASPRAEKARCCGAFSVAEVPRGASTAPAVPLPTNVDTVPLGRMRRMRLLFWSET